MCKSKDYEEAMSRYHRSFFFQNIGLAVSAVVMTLQVVSLLAVPWSTSMMSFPGIACLAAAYLVADFVNGFVHMWMDNNNEYRSPIGPMVAVFHLHHRYPVYRHRNPLAIYFFESGSKNWLAVYLILVVLAQSYLGLHPLLSLFLACVGVLSSVAELSHYWCHNSKHPAVRALQKAGLLLSPEHHHVHHEYDNMHYAFLNGATDPLLNVLAYHFFDGYQGRSDVHVSAYTGRINSNRG